MGEVSEDNALLRESAGCCLRKWDVFFMSSPVQLFILSAKAGGFQAVFSMSISSAMALMSRNISKAATIKRALKVHTPNFGVSSRTSL